MELIIESLPPKFNVSVGEIILLCIKGTNKEWLVCTDKKLYIVKRGFMTGHTFGDGVLQFPYKNISGVQTEYHILSGYFQVSSGGMQNTKKDYWAQGQDSPQASPNCVTILGKELLQKFKTACNFINEKIAESHETVSTAPTPINDIASQIIKISELHKLGILTDKEYETKKSELLSRM